MRRVALTIALLSALGSRARAGNDDGILVGGYAALTGGAVTATTDDGAAGWYNPAGLARITRHSFDINASAYGVSMTRADGIFALDDGRTADARVVDWQLVPSALSYSRVLSKHLVGSVGVFIPYTTDGDLRSSLRLANDAVWTVGLDQLRNEYNYVASLGIRVGDTLRLGVSLHGVYVSSETMSLVGRGTPTSMLGDQPFYLGVLHETRGEYGLRIGLGVQWTPRPELELGLAVQTPTLTGFRSIRSDRLGGSFAGAMGGGYEQENVDALQTPWDLSTPLFVRLGAAYALDRLKLLLDGSLVSPLDAAGESLDRRINGNVRVGATYTQSERILYGLGMFTDRSGYREHSPSFVGCSGGVRLSSHYTISEGQRRLTFTTTLAGRYAYGWGNAPGASLVDENQSVRAKIQVHELAFNLGGSVTF